MATLGKRQRESTPETPSDARDNSTRLRIDKDSSEIVDAPHPFDNPKADIIIRSSDGVDFRMFKIILSLASRIFRDAFESPASTEQSKDGVSYVVVGEDSRTLTILLGSVFPGKTSNFETLTDVRTVMEASFKYEMEDLAEGARKALMEPRFLEKEPAGVFAIAYHSRLAESARTAARYTLRQPILAVFSPELECISGAVYHRLLDYHQQCGSAASAVPSKDKDAPPFLSGDEQLDCNFCAQGTGKKQKANAARLRTAWADYLSALSNELEKRPYVGVITGDEETFSKVSALAMQCNKSGCRNRTFNNLKHAREELVRSVEAAISGIPIPVEF
ncbi:hypothetical protein JAAARDRAFT_199979 [Jaapia argillacea MUCL 33604]|uniref:BTB domain-containing protein n=1 Tax=Jaapia argillacea MUCL 33604 TaxID=933084 RepID=A0A067P9G6_9AGAM|nr:hypothetical protein JAAARDRAFT_199979 [Jaapia argillacea MUCL 33604]